MMRLLDLARAAGFAVLLTIAACALEIADNDAEREQGLMYRRSMAADHGMLFIFDPPSPEGFWMHNTFLPLDIIFIGADGRIVNIAADATPFSDDNIPSAGPVRGVLELNAGRAAALGILPGDRVRHRIFGAN
ncbi:MAG: DUF192 domain-containing protein [Proteobacteria bacterium]|nr:DUF192 domain-containing protein [Pseudomonadota bacterium]